MRLLDCDLAVMAGEHSSLVDLACQESLQVPWWVNAEIDCEAVLAGRNSKALRKDIRKIEKNALYVGSPRSSEDVQYFYDRMYLPTIQQSHGDAALPSSTEIRRRQIQSNDAELVLVMHDETAIGGTVIDYRHGVPALRDIGVLDGDNKYKNQGVITAANYFAIQKLADLGHQKVSMGLSRCFVDDGVFAYKTKWRPKFFADSRDDFLMTFNTLSNATRAFLVSSDCIVDKNGELQRVRFASSDTSQDLERYRPVAATAIEGIEKTIWFDVAGDKITPIDAPPAT